MVSEHVPTTQQLHNVLRLKWTMYYSLQLCCFVVHNGSLLVPPHHRGQSINQSVASKGMNLKTTSKSISAKNKQTKSLKLCRACHEPDITLQSRPSANTHMY